MTNVKLEVKVQTVYFEDTSVGEMKKHVVVSDKRLSMKDASIELQSQGYQNPIVLRTLTSRATVELTQEELEQRITNVEPFYQTKED